MIIAAFDIGKLNLCVYIEKVDEIKFLGKSMNTVLGHGEIILWKNHNITKDCHKSKYIDPILFYNLTELLDTYTSYWDMCDVILIEQQMSFGFKKINTLALKLAQHCFSYFQIKYKLTKQIIDYPAYHKTQLLCAPKKMSKPQRKKWAVEKAQEILKLRNITNVDFEKSKKEDDYADTLCMTQAYKLAYEPIRLDSQPKYSIEELTKLKCDSLKTCCKKHKLITSGKKMELIERLLTIKD